MKKAKANYTRTRRRNSVIVREWMKKHNLGVDRTAQLTRCSSHAVNSWLRTFGVTSHREPSDAAVELMAIKLEEPLPFGRDW